MFNLFVLAFFFIGFVIETLRSKRESRLYGFYWVQLVFPVAYGLAALGMVLLILFGPRV